MIQVLANILTAVNEKKAKAIPLLSNIVMLD
jgi:hypothetical protein